MNAPATASMPRALSVEHRERLLRTAREVSFPMGARLFEEGGQADRFWIIRTGTVDLDMRVPGRPAAVIESLGHNELLGWSWLYPPHVWHLGAEAASLRAYEFDSRRGARVVPGRPRIRQEHRPLGRRGRGRPVAGGPRPAAGPVRPARQRVPALTEHDSQADRPVEEWERSS